MMPAPARARSCRYRPEALERVIERALHAFAIWLFGASSARLVERPRSPATTASAQFWLRQVYGGDLTIIEHHVTW
jgi:hypothetical protein